MPKLKKILSNFQTMCYREIYSQIANIDATGEYQIAIHTFAFKLSIFFSRDARQRPFIVFSFLRADLTQDLMQVLHKKS